MNNSGASAEYFKQYRKKLGFTNQNSVASFFGAKDVVPAVDFNYIKILNDRLGEMMDKINSVVSEEVRIDNMSSFKEEYINKAFKIIGESNILPKLNNQGRRTENVYFNWMRGYLISNYFSKALGIIFGIDTSDIELIGNDDLRNPEIFRRTPKADLEIKLNDKEKIRIEAQSGFTGMSDIKQHKILEAKRVFSETGVHTLAIHFDLYNGQVAFVGLDKINIDNIQWIKREQMEGQKVMEIDQGYFIWKIAEPPVKYSEIIDVVV